VPLRAAAVWPRNPPGAGKSDLPNTGFPAVCCRIALPRRFHASPSPDVRRPLLDRDGELVATLRDGRQLRLLTGDVDDLFG
jgi:hypothetical protein